MNDETYTPCTKCGRPMAYCKGQCCGQPKGCECREYGPMKKGCIRQIEPSCPYEAVIPTLTVEDKSNLKDLADCFVHVSNINTTFYIDDKHRTIVTWAGPVEYDNYDLDANSLGLRSQFLIDHANDYAAYYDKTGAYQKFNFSESGGETLSFTMQYDAGTQASVFPGWQEVSRAEKICTTTGTPAYDIYKTVWSYSHSEQYPVTFLNDATNEVVTPAELYALLLDGNDIILNHVPLGVKVSGELGDATGYVDGVRLLNRFVEPSPYEITGFGGSAFLNLNMPYPYGSDDSFVPTQSQFGFTISGYRDGDSLIYDGMTIQGVVIVPTAA